jgi:hypothetical protein
MAATIMNFWGFFKQVLKLFWNFLLHLNIVIDSMVPRIQISIRIKKDMIRSSFIDIFETLWIPAAAALISIFWGDIKQVLKLFWDFLLHLKIVIHAMVQTDSSFDVNRKRYNPFFICRQIYYFLNSSSSCYNFNFRGCYKQVLKLFWDCFMYGKIVIDAMVRTDSNFDENQKRYDPFFIRQWI